MVRVFCLGEDFRLDMRTAACRSSVHLLIDNLLKQAVMDECQHGLLGELYLDWINEGINDVERQRPTTLSTGPSVRLNYSSQGLRRKVERDYLVCVLNSDDIREAHELRSISRSDDLILLETPSVNGFGCLWLQIIFACLMI